MSLQQFKKFTNEAASGLLMHGETKDAEFWIARGKIADKALEKWEKIQQ